MTGDGWIFGGLDRNNMNMAIDNFLIQCSERRTVKQARFADVNHTRFRYWDQLVLSNEFLVQGNNASHCWGSNSQLLDALPTAQHRPLAHYVDISYLFGTESKWIS